MSEITRNPIYVTDTDGNGDKHYLSDYPETISAEIGGLYEEPKSPTLWRDMTLEEKGALLLAHHEGKEIEYYSYGIGWVTERPNFFGWCAYRIKPEPKVEVVVLLGGKDYLWAFEDHTEGGMHNTHRITFNTIDGKPDPASIKMTAL